MAETFRISRHNAESFQSELNRMMAEISKCLEEGAAIVSVKQETATDKQLRAMHLWCRQCEQALNKQYVYKKGALTGKDCKWADGDFKSCVYKPFIRHYKGMGSTKDQGKKTVSEVVEALTAHILQEHGGVLPEFPCEMVLSMKALLSV